MNESSESLQDSIARQRAQLATVLFEPLRRLATECSEVWPDRRGLDERLIAGLSYVPYCKFLYALDTNAVQISDNISHEGVIEGDFGRDRSARPYMNEAVPSTGFLLSDAYISMRVRRPSLTAIQVVRDATWNVVGFVGADFDLRSLPLTRELYKDPTHWRQIKGDPAIRSTVFHNTRIDSRMDRHMEEVIGVLEELVVDHGVFHVTLHFSSSRATIWLMDDPYRYRLLDIESLIDPDTCLAYPRHGYPSDATIPADRIRPILEGFQELRFMDDMLYLRSSSVNIFNGMLRLTFSCDGSHYIAFEEFLDRSHAFWAAGNPAA